MACWLIFRANLQVILLLIQQWLERAAEHYAAQSPRKPTRPLPCNVSIPQADGHNTHHRPRQSYQVINSMSVAFLRKLYMLIPPQTCSESCVVALP